MNMDDTDFEVPVAVPVIFFGANLGTNKAAKKVMYLAIACLVLGAIRTLVNCIYLIDRTGGGFFVVVEPFIWFAIFAGIPLCGFYGAKNRDMDLLVANLFCNGCCALCNALNVLAFFLLLFNSTDVLAFAEEDTDISWHHIATVVISGICLPLFVLATIYAFLLRLRISMGGDPVIRRPHVNVTQGIPVATGNAARVYPVCNDDQELPSAVVIVTEPVTVLT